MLREERSRGGRKNVDVCRKRATRSDSTIVRANVREPVVSENGAITVSPHCLVSNASLSENNPVYGITALSRACSPKLPPQSERPTVPASGKRVTDECLEQSDRVVGSLSSSG